MKVGVIGGGAIGLLTAAYLCQTKIETVMYTRRREQAEILNEHGLTFKKHGLETIIKIVAKPFSTYIGNEDLLIVTVKQYDLEPLIHYLEYNNIITPILFLQNGMGHIANLSRLKSQLILLGIVEHGAMRLSDYKIEQTGEGQIKIATYRGEVNDLWSIFESLNNVGYPIKREAKWQPMLVNKLIVNAIINPLTAIYKIHNGALLENQFYFENMKNLFVEIVSVLPIENKDHGWETILSICSQTRANHSSMYKDLENGRLTEIDSILGYILSEAEKKKIAMPLTGFLYKSIKGLERKGE